MEKYFLELIFGFISVGCIAFCKYLWNQNKNLKALQEEDKNEQYRKMILKETQPITEELLRIEQEIKKVDKHAENMVQQIKDNEDQQHKTMYQDLHNYESQTNENFDLIINSYKFRLVQLCKSHLEDGYITMPDLEQLTEMYKLYSGLGGNGQAKIYFDKVKELEIKHE